MLQHTVQGNTQCNIVVIVWLSREGKFPCGAIGHHGKMAIIFFHLFSSFIPIWHLLLLIIVLLAKATMLLILTVRLKRKLQFPKTWFTLLQNIKNGSLSHFYMFVCCWRLSNLLLTCNEAFSWHKHQHMHVIWLHVIVPTKYTFLIRRTIEDAKYVFS